MTWNVQIRFCFVIHIESDVDNHTAYNSKSTSGAQNFQCAVAKRRFVPWPSIKMFSGLISRWSTPCLCIWLNPEATCSMYSHTWQNLRPTCTFRLTEQIIHSSLPSTNYSYTKKLPLRIIPNNEVKNPGLHVSLLRSSNTWCSSRGCLRESRSIRRLPASQSSIWI